MIRFLYIFISVGMMFLFGCRARLETSRQMERHRSEEIGVELRRVDSLWSSIAENLNYKIEFYPPLLDSALSLPQPSVPAACGLANAYPPGGVSGCIGAVKSIEISAGKTEHKMSITKTDSVASQKNAYQEALQTETSSQARQDNGTVATVFIVAAVAVLVFLLLKKKLKKW